MATALASNRNCNKAFSDGYVLLNPQHAHFFDLCRLLFSRNIGHRKFVDSNAGGAVEGSFRQRWLIFVSVVAQKLLIFLAKPLSLFGICVEISINFVALNGGLFTILFNFFTVSKSSYPVKVKWEGSGSSSVQMYLEIFLNLDSSSNFIY